MSRLCHMKVAWLPLGGHQIDVPKVHETPPHASTSAALLTEQLEAELERLMPEVDVEPELPTPRPNGPLAGIAPAS